MKLDENSLKAKPRIVASGSLEGLTLTPEEGFVLSLIDGKTSIGEILMISTLPQERTLELLKKLLDYGVITLDDSEGPISKWWSKSSGKSDRRLENSDVKKEERKVSEDSIPEEVLRDIERMYQFVQTRNYYDILGLPRKASKEAIRQAYRSLSRKYHPDQYYQKVSPETRKKLDVIFATISEAYSTLSNPEMRREYDEELATGVKKRKIKIDIAEKEADTPKEKAYRLITLGDEAYKNREYSSALNNYKLARQLIGSLPSLDERIRKAQIASDLRRMVEKIEKDEMLLELDTVKEMVSLVKANLTHLPPDPELLVRAGKIMMKMTRAYRVAAELFSMVKKYGMLKNDVVFLLAEAKKESGDVEGAIRELEEILKRDRKNTEIREKIRELKLLLKQGSVR